MEVASLIQSAVFLSLVLTVFASTGVIASPLRASEVKVTSNFLLDEDSHSLSPLTDGLLKFVPAASGPVAMAPEAGVAFILAANRTRRPDVLEKFRPYKGGWDMTNKHYWASVSFTGATGFILAVVWLTSFAVALIALRCCKWRILFMEKASERPHQQIGLLLLLLFTCAASTGCALLSVGQDEFHDEVFDTLKYVVNQSDFVVQILRNVTDYLSLAKKINVDEYYIAVHVQNEIDKLDFDLKSATHTISEKTVENSEKTRRVMNDTRHILIVVAAIMLLISIIGFALSILRHRHAIYVFITSGWLLVAVTLVLCGAFVILNNAVGDTCTAMDEWVHHPQAETALSNILPCVDQQTTNRTLYQTKEVILQIVSVVNSVIRSIVHSNNTRAPRVFNQSKPSIPLLCSPYNSQLLRRPCQPQEVSFGNASQLCSGPLCSTASQPPGLQVCM
ncbi:hypothetical protein HPP92_004425 [Vanilla planifolia]|uniref:Transmembrane protein n=1 Tax=Vanilla planifolia TaxID=51239 RepID=A0A835RJT0_VANPL|nr:hypothetical protein HPP92_004425 [Vanilla planifolia]